MKKGVINIKQDNIHYNIDNIDSNKLDEYVVYCDTDSIKLIQGYDKSVIDDYNNSVMSK